MNSIYIYIRVKLGSGFSLGEVEPTGGIGWQQPHDVVRWDVVLAMVGEEM